ncbi:hypothetical protein C0Q70_04817 [Pomacea canaliculata]|uniref:TIR domain-containing protein n=2 Tax=Pomacea canaliculata TaxID=400727 RepID=A0A2T7PJH5_POMCA|nr:hypothetical protein C0Q70_04817 [Pomacea canaliculata]
MHKFIAGIDPGTFTNPSLEILYMSDNNIYFSHDTISSKMFAGCPRLVLLQLDHNNFANVTDTKFQELFQDNPILRIVYLGYNKIENVTNSTFKGLSHVKELNLYSNPIKDLPDGVFDHLVNLTILRLDDNQLSEIRKTTFGASTRQRLRQLDLSGNPYACTCSLRWFRSWVMHERQKFINFPKGYVCATVSSSSSEQVGKTQRNVTRYVGESDDNLKLNSNDFGRLQGLLGSSSFQELSNSHQSDFLLSDSNYFVRRNLEGYVSLPTAYGEVYLSDFILSDQACLLSQSTSLLTAVLAAVLVVFMLTFLMLYKYRWHIRLALYEAFRGNPQRQQQPEREYEYDVFVSYANEDVDWVRQELIPTLEGRHGLRLCIHQRDFPVGGNIIDNISTCVHSSKRVLFVLSPHFARSRWCQFELVFCQNYVMERDDVIVLTLLAPISGRDMTDAISAMFKTTTYLAWGEEDDARKAFWGRLVLAFHDIVPRQVA